MLRSIFLIAVISALLILPANVMTANGLTLRDVDYIRIKSFFENDVLVLQVEFINKNTDNLVLWDKKQVTYEYVVYKTLSMTSTKKLKRIFQGQKTLSRSYQSTYLDVIDQLEPQTWYLIECTLNINYRTLIARTTFALSK